VISKDGITFSTKKREKVLDFDLPQSQQELKGFLGLCGYFRAHVPHYAELAEPLQVQLKAYDKRKRIRWSDTSLSAFKSLQTAVANCPKLFFAREEGGEVIVETDASDYGIGAYLYQRFDDGVDKAGKPRFREVPIQFLSKSLSKQERRWSTIEKEAYAIFYSLQKWEHLLRDTKFLLRTDHLNLTYMNLNVKQKVQRWKLAIQGFDFDIEHIPGKQNIIADGFSRFCTKKLQVDNLPEVAEEKVNSILKRYDKAERSSTVKTLQFKEELSQTVIFTETDPPLQIAKNIVIAVNNNELIQIGRAHV
jgi:hypothetical protein